MLSAGQADVRGDGVAGRGSTVTSVSSSRAMRLRSRAGVAGSFQIAGRSVTSWLDPGLLGVGELPGVCFGGLVVGVLGVGEFAQGGVPVGFEGVGDEPVGGVDGEVAAPGVVGVVAGAFDVRGAEPVGLGRRGARVRR